MENLVTVKLDAQTAALVRDVLRASAEHGRSMYDPVIHTCTAGENETIATMLERAAETIDAVLP